MRQPEKIPRDDPYSTNEMDRVDWVYVHRFGEKICEEYFALMGENRKAYAIQDRVVRVAVKLELRPKKAEMRKRIDIHDQHGESLYAKGDLPWDISTSWS